MAQRVFLHVGLPKSGTTFVQSILSAHKDLLADDHGLLFPGRDWKDQVRAARDVREMRGHNARTRAMAKGAWDRLAAEINDWSGDAVFSMEWLCQARHHQIERMVKDVAPASVDVVFTVRDLGRRIPASWQESVLNENLWSWREFLDDISADDPPGLSPAELPPRRFWKMHDVVRHLAHWTSVLPPEQVHVVTVPAAGASPSLLWDRFCDVLGIDAPGLSTEARRRNDSLDLASTEMVRRLNLRFRDAGLSHKQIVVQQLAKSGLSRGRTRPARATVPEDLHPWLQARAEREIAGVEAAGVHVVGDLDDLLPDLTRHRGGPQPDELSDADMLDAALDALVTAVRDHAKSVRTYTREIEAKDAENARLARREARLRVRLARWQEHPVRAAVRSRIRRRS